MLRKIQRISISFYRNYRFRRDIDRTFCGAFEDQKAIFIHIPKAAGSSIALSLFGHQVGHKSILEYYQRDFHKADTYFKFAFVRHPMDRLYSAFSFLRNGGMNTKDQAFAEKFLSNLSFGEFVKRLAEDPSMLEWYHFRQQFTYLYDGFDPKNILVNYVGKYENLETDLKSISNRLGTGQEIPHLNPTSRTVSVGEEGFSKETIELVAQIYAEDFEVFGYSLPSL